MLRLADHCRLERKPPVVVRFPVHRSEICHLASLRYGGILVPLYPVSKASESGSLTIGLSWRRESVQPRLAFADIN